MENVVLSQFAQMRVRDRMGMTQEELIERIKQNKYAVVGIRKTRERSPLKSVVVWDHVANKPFLVNFFKENEKGSLIVATVVNTFKDHKYAKGVFVTRKHIVMARLAIAPQKVSRK